MAAVTCEEAEHEFHLRIDGGEVQVFKAHTSTYVHAVMAAFGTLRLPFPCTVEIWVPSLVAAGYGPYTYRIANFVDALGNEYCPAIMNVFAKAAAEAV